MGQFFAVLPALPDLIQGTLSYFYFRPILGGFMAEPPQHVINGLHPRLSKLVEIGTIYTTVAGLLNVLAIYDAYEGPAYADIEEENDHAFDRDVPKALKALKAEGQARCLSQSTSNGSSSPSS